MQVYTKKVDKVVTKNNSLFFFLEKNCPVHEPKNLETFLPKKFACL